MKVKDVVTRTTGELRYYLADERILYKDWQFIDEYRGTEIWEAEVEHIHMQISGQYIIQLGIFLKEDFTS